MSKHRVLTDKEKYDIMLRALRRIANIDHAESCTMKCVPIYECTCMIDPRTIARTALGNVNAWEKRWNED